MSLFKRKAQRHVALTNHQAIYGNSGYAVSSQSYAYQSISAPAVEDKGLAIEPIIGIREFNVEMEPVPTLYSFNDCSWPQRAPLYAVCGADPLPAHEVPGERCSCGIYAWKPECPNINGKVWGEVYLWGEVLICDYGYRAEIAYPKSLTIRSNPTRSALRVRDGLEESYGVPVKMVEPIPTGLEAAQQYVAGATGATGAIGAGGISFANWAQMMSMPTQNQLPPPQGTP